MDELKDKFTQEDKDMINSKKEPLETALNEFSKSENKDEAIENIKKLYEEFNNTYQPIIQKVYAEANPQANTQRQSNPFQGQNPFGDMFNGAQTQK